MAGGDMELMEEFKKYGFLPPELTVSQLTAQAKLDWATMKVKANMRYGEPLERYPPLEELMRCLPEVLTSSTNSSSADQWIFQREAMTTDIDNECLVNHTTDHQVTPPTTLLPSDATSPPNSMMNHTNEFDYSDVHALQLSDNRIFSLIPQHIYRHEEQMQYVVQSDNHSPSSSSFIPPLSCYDDCAFPNTTHQLEDKPDLAVKDTTRVLGVHWDPRRKRWYAMWYDAETRRKTKRSFSIGKYGSTHARELAIQARLNGMMCNTIYESRIVDRIGRVTEGSSVKRNNNNWGSSNINRYYDIEPKNNIVTQSSDVQQSFVLPPDHSYPQDCPCYELLTINNEENSFAHSEHQLEIPQKAFCDAALQSQAMPIRQIRSSYDDGSKLNFNDYSFIQSSDIPMRLDTGSHQTPTEENVYFVSTC